MEKITRLSLRHRRLVALGWIVLTVIAGLSVSSATSGLSHSEQIPGSPGSAANVEIMKRLGFDGHEAASLAVLKLPSGTTMGSAEGRAIAARTFDAAYRAGHVAVADYANTGNPKLVSADGRTTWALITMPNPDNPATAGTLNAVPHALSAAAPAGETVTVTGYTQLEDGAGAKGGGPSVLVESLIGAAGALIVLAFVYGSAIAIVPLLMALPSILITFLLVLGMEQIFTLNNLVEYLVAFIGLGVAVDYSLLVVTRWREEHEAGLENEQAILKAGRTAGRAVLLSGLTVAVGLLSLLVLPVPFLRSIGAGSMLIPLVAIAASVTLLPVTLAAWGPALDRRRFRRGSTTFSKGWERWGELAVRRRWTAALIGLVIVIGMAIPALSMNSGEPNIQALTRKGPTTNALRVLERQGVPDAASYPVQLLVRGGSASAALTVRIAESTPGAYTVLSSSAPALHREGETLISVIPAHEGNTSQGRDLVTSLRSRLASVPGGVAIGGNTAELTDFNNAVYGNVVLMIAALSLLIFLILARAFRSVVLALKAVILNVVSLGASYGFLTLFWQDGHGSQLIYGVPATGAIRNWIPILSFAFLFGLSMDYEVFVLSRIREEYDASGSTGKAIASGLARTGRLVTCASLIIAISLLSLSTTPDLPVRVIATGLAFGILLDAVVVRTLLVPALIALMGKWNWWMPDGLARLLRIPAAAPVSPAPPVPAAQAVAAQGDAWTQG